jgi:hypothetical protein
LGSNNVSAIYLGTLAVWPVVTSGQLTLTATGGASWNSGGDGLSSAAAYTKSSWTDSGNGSSDETLKAVALSAGIIHVTWTDAYATATESSYGEADVWANNPPGTGSAAIDLQTGSSSGAGSYNLSVASGGYVVLHRHGFATWSGIKVWWTA